MGNHTGQQELFETEAARSLLDQLLTDSRLYTRSKDYKEPLFKESIRHYDSLIRPVLYAVGGEYRSDGAGSRASGKELQAEPSGDEDFPIQKRRDFT